MDFRKPYLIGIGAFISIIYAVGLLALVTHNLSILRLTPVNMLVSCAVLNLAYKPDLRLFKAQALVFCFGFFIEVLGVYSESIFGSYVYMQNLGPKVWETPLIMGVNWIVTVFCSASMVYHLNLKTSNVVKALCGSAFMVFMDLFIEPICEKAGFWSWKDGQVPIQNYIAWFVFGFLIQFGLIKAKIGLNNWMSFLLYALQLIFFIFAHIYL